MPHILEQTADQLRDWFRRHGLPAYRAGQVRKWLFQKRAAAFDEMTDLPAALATAACRRVPDLDHADRPAPQGGRRHRKTPPRTARRRADRVRPVARRQAALHRLHQHAGRLCDGLRLLRHRPRRRDRNLTTGEIVEQMLRLQQLLGRLPPRGCRAAQPRGGDGHGRAAAESRRPAAGPGHRHRPRRAGHQRPPDHDFHGRPARGHSPTGPGELPISLGRVAARRHDALRNELVPANRGFGIAAILAAADEYFELDRPPRHLRIRLAGRRERSSRSTPGNWQNCSAAGRRW